jgi:hypothetical protein
VKRRLAILAFIFTFSTVPMVPQVLGGILGEKLAEEGLSRLLNDQLPLKLDANTVYPTVAVLPGGAFAPQPLSLSSEDLDRPLPPGDYTILVLAFCTEYSVHRPGRGVAYRLGALQGKASQAIAALLWRGTLEKGIPPPQLQAVSWAIQSGLRYSQMPQTYQALIDNVIPDYKSELSGDFMQSLEDSYSSLARGTHLPPLQQMLAKMGKPGELALSAQKQRDALLRQNTSDQIREQTLFAGQESGIYTPVSAAEGPWTERIPGVAYVRFKVDGGNLANNNVLEIRILPHGAALAQSVRAPHLIYASLTSNGAAPALAAAQQSDAGTSPSLHGLLEGTIGYSEGQGAQALISVPQTSGCPAGQTYHPPQSLTALANQSCSNPSNGARWDTGVDYLQIYMGFCSGSRVNAIKFQVSCSSPDQEPRLVQFMNEQVCPASGDTSKCLPGTANVLRSPTCTATQNLTEDPSNPNWYLDSLGPTDSSGLQDPYYEDGVAGSIESPGGLITADEPSTTVNDPNADQRIAAGQFTLRKSFTDFVLCGKTVVGTFTWQRITSGGTSAYVVGPVTPATPGQIKSFSGITKQQGFSQWAP